MKIIRYFIGLLLFSGCTTKEEIITGNKWKYQDGFHIGDIVYFDTTNYYKLDSNNQIYKEGIFIAVIDNVTKKTNEDKI